MDVDEAATRLYERPLDEFMATRTELADRAKTDGDAETARAIKAMRKPTVAAWVLNQLVRTEPQAVSDLVALGEAMRSATAASDGATLRDLTATRKTLTATLAQQAKSLASSAGYQVNANLTAAIDDTLTAAVSDPSAGVELLSGQLTKSLEHAGFGALPSNASADVISLNAARTARVNSPPKKARRMTKEDAREAAERELREADSALDDAEHRVSELRPSVTQLRQRADEAKSRVDQLSAELAEAQRALRDAERDAESAEEQLESARREVDVASRRRRDARLAAHQYTGS